MRAARPTTYFAALLSSNTSCITNSFSPPTTAPLVAVFTKSQRTTNTDTIPILISKRHYHNRRMHARSNTHPYNNNFTTYRGRALYATQEPSFDWNHIPSISSTQDEAKRRLSEDNTTSRFAISASEQTLGRGTSGRTWVSNQGNVYLTVVLPWDSLPVPVTLLPLKVGCIIAQNVRQILWWVVCGGITKKLCFF